MKKRKGVSATFCFLIAATLLLAAFSVPAVFATWQYTDESVEPADAVSGMTISEFAYSPAEVLPVAPGENHQALMGEVMDNMKVGLNGSKDALENAVNKLGVVYSFTNIQGGTLKHLLAGDAAWYLEFVIQYQTDAQYYLYTFEDDDLAAAEVNVTSIPVYRTTMEYNSASGIWESTEAYAGHSLVRLNSGNRTIDPVEWVPGTLET